MPDTWVVNIPFPEEVDKDIFIAQFYFLENEGLEEKEQEIEVYFSADNFSEESLAESISGLIGSKDFSIGKMPVKNWNEEWEKHFQPLSVSDKIYIRAPFHEKKNDFEYQLIIEPKMSFGTGHHATTRQCLEMMLLLEFKNKTVFDCGSGTGILAIFSEILGANQAIALDNDEWCYNNVKDNILFNHCRNILPVFGELTVIKENFDIILANITRNYLSDNLGLLAQKLNNKGYLIMSGFHSIDAKALLNKALEFKLIAHYLMSSGEWDCILFQKNE